MLLTVNMCQEKEEKDMSALKTALRPEEYIEKRGGRLITATRNTTDDTKTNGTKITRKQNWEEKQLYGHFK